MSVVIYTVITGDYDQPKPTSLPGLRCVMVTDGEGAHGWERMPVQDLPTDLRRLSRHAKCMPHLYFPDATDTIYFDGAFAVKDPLWLLHYIKTADAALFAHHGGHKSHHDERDFYQRQHGYVPDDIEAHHQRMVQRGVPDTGRFWACGVIARKNNEATRAHGEAWWADYITGSHNDQLSFVEALHTSPMTVETIPGVNIEQRSFPWTFHR